MTLGKYHKPHIYPDGDKWCAVWVGFRDLQLDPAGFGDTPELAHAELEKTMMEKLPFESFEIGGFCRKCRGFVPDDFKEPGCNGSDCPMQPPHKAELWQPKKPSI